jgi:hypothetical protein
MKSLIHSAELVRAYLDWTSVADVVPDPTPLVAVADKLVAEHTSIVQTIRSARRLADACPRSLGARLLNEVLDLAGGDAVLKGGFLDGVRKARSRLKRLARGKAAQG